MKIEPVKYPDLSSAEILAFDCETKDPHLKRKGKEPGMGAGVYRKDGYVLGVSVSDGVFSEYYNLGHWNCSAETAAKNRTYLKDLLENHKGLKVGARLSYDLDWLGNGEGWDIQGPFYDVLMAEGLIDAYNRKNNLDFCAQKYLGLHKEKDEIDKWCEDNGRKITKEVDARAYLWEMPWELVRKYAIADAVLPIKIREEQMKIIDAEELNTVLDVEMGLIPLYMKQRKIGIRIDSKAVASGTKFCKEKIAEADAFIKKEYGAINLNSYQQVGKLFQEYGLETGLTKTKRVTANKRQFKKYEDDVPIVTNIVQLKSYSKALNDYFEGAYTKLLVDGRIHTDLEPLPSEDGGARTGRFSARNPNLQNQPSRHPVLAGLCRSCFIPEKGCSLLSIDWSSIEYRVFANFATGAGAAELRKAYNENPYLDFHQQTCDMTGLERKPAKNVNFLALYGGGVNALMDNTGWGEEYATEVLNRYHRSMPMVRSSIDKVGKVTRQRGYVKTLLGRRARYRASSYNEDYKFLNYLVQGSAADVLKKSMLEAWEAGVFDVLHPHTEIHDELLASMPETKIGWEAGRELQNIMENCLSDKLDVPLVSDFEVGPNWASCKGVSKEELDKKIKSL